MKFFTFIYTHNKYSLQVLQCTKLVFSVSRAPSKLLNTFNTMYFHALRGLAVFPGQQTFVSPQQLQGQRLPESPPPSLVTKSASNVQSSNWETKVYARHIRRTFAYYLESDNPRTLLIWTRSLIKHRHC